MIDSSLQRRHLLFRTTNSDLFDLGCGKPNTNGYGLAVLATNSNPVIELQIVADSCDLTQHSWSIADQRRALHRRRNVTVFDEVGLAGRKNELTAGDIDLAATELDGVQTLFHGLDD